MLKGAFYYHTRPDMSEALEEYPESFRWCNEGYYLSNDGTWKISGASHIRRRWGLNGWEELPCVNKQRIAAAITTVLRTPPFPTSPEFVIFPEPQNLESVFRKLMAGRMADILSSKVSYLDGPKIQRRAIRPG